MKQIATILTGIILMLILSNCKTIEKTSGLIVYEDSIFIKTTDKLTINIKKGESFNHPTFVIWMEDMEENIIKTIFVTKSFASGIFGYQMVDDSIWLRTSGESYQPAALPYWNHKKGLIDNEYLVPTPDHPYIDALTGATPDDDFRLVTGTKPPGDQYRILLEVNQAWDWNRYWTNNKYPDNFAYKHSAQPSVVYSVTINKENSKFYLNPIGHGDPKGETGRLFTDLSTITNGMNIFESISIEVKN